LTPAVILAALFATACAAVSITFVAARGGLQLPVAAISSQAAAVASATPGAPAPTPSQATPSPAESSPETTLAPPSPTPAGATPGPSPTPADPLAVLPPCPGHPGCYLYTVQRGDTLSTIADRWGLSLSLVEALNPEITNPSTIAVGQTIYLGRSQVVRLDPCPDRANCYLYVVRPGDRLSTIAGRYGTTTSAILALNPKITNANQIYSGETIRIPGPA
jgi:nucleoid-associated protein YgaU